MARLSKEQKAKIRQSILEESKTLFMEVGYDKTSTAKIAKAVGIAEGTIFNYFDSKADIFLEVLALDIALIADEDDDLNLSDGVVEVIYEFITRKMNAFINMPKRLLKEIFGAMVTIAKKRTGLIRRLAELDYQVLDELEALLEGFKNRGILDVENPRLAAESVYSVILFEFTIYVYEDDRKKEETLARTKEKVKFVMEPYIKR